MSYLTEELKVESLYLLKYFMKSEQDESGSKELGFILGKITKRSDYVKASKGFTLAWGLIAIIFASVGNLFENLIQLVNIIGSVFYGTILGVFLVAIFIQHIKGKAIFWAAVLSEALIIILFSQDVVSFLWLNLIGAVLTVVLGLVFQKLFYDK